MGEGVWNIKQECDNHMTFTELTCSEQNLWSHWWVLSTPHNPLDPPRSSWDEGHSPRTSLAGPAGSEVHVHCIHTTLCIWSYTCLVPGLWLASGLHVHVQCTLKKIELCKF